MMLECAAKKVKRSPTIAARQLPPTSMSHKRFAAMSGLQNCSKEYHFGPKCAFLKPEGPPHRLQILSAPVNA
jgi:hypothetical protein